MTDQKSEIRPLNDPPASSLPPSKTEATKPPKSTLPAWRRALRLFLGMLIFFGLGGVTVLFWQLLPARQQLDKGQQQLQALQTSSAADLQNTRQEMVDLSTQVSDLQGRQNEFSQATLYTALLEVQLDVANARLALANKESNKARLFLSNTDQTMTEIADALPEDQRSVISDLQARLRLAINAIGVKDDVAQSDLALLAADLLEIESTFTR